MPLSSFELLAHFSIYRYSFETSIGAVRSTSGETPGGRDRSAKTPGGGECLDTTMAMDKIAESLFTSGQEVTKVINKHAPRQAPLAIELLMVS